jgi:two-component sensor histidine kinase
MGEDYPYFETRGFSKEFVEKENRLCAVDLKGQIMRDEIGNPLFECMCGNILCARFDPAKPFFTKKGSFWSNCTTKLLASTTDADRQARTRNRCNAEGYESVALIRIRSGNDTFGLIQLNDKRTDRFTLMFIETMEHFADLLAASLADKKSKTELMEAVKEKEFLLRELNHRVNNNLQLISSLLTLQGKYTHDKNADSVLLDCKNRIRSIGLVHEKLYLIKGVTNIDLREYISELVRNIFNSLVDKSSGIKLIVDVENLALDVERSIICGLIINELVSNSLKYAFTDKRNAEILISLHAHDNGMVEMVYRDNGVGIPAHVDIATTKTLGLQLIMVMAQRQLESTVELKRDHGTVFRFVFKAVL